MHNAPERIYLQIDPDATDPTDEFLFDGVTWCQDKVNETDVEYVRADEIDRLRAEVAELLHEQAVLRDPVSLHANLLRGIPATLTKEQLLHLAGCTDYDALKKDSERLSFIEAQGSPGIGWIARHSFTGRGYRLHQDPSFNTATAREAIDAARAKDKP